ncbi:WRKY transcription factor [Asimina triloba]
MEKLGEWEKSIVINELMQGQESVKQLQMHLDPSSPTELRESLVRRIWLSLAKAISMLKCKNDPDQGDPQLIGGGGPTNNTDSPHSFSGSPHSHSENSDRDLERRDICKKRKLLPRWTQQVRVCNGTGLDGSLDDGCSWRKYGQKDILGAKFPRSYYRCTHRHAQGCIATKQVQRSDDDPAIFEITYRGAHTCTQASSSHGNPNGMMPSSSSSSPRKQERQEQQQLLLDFRTGLKIKTDDELDRQNRINASSFSFPWASSTDVGMSSMYTSNINNIAGAGGTGESSIFSASALAPLENNNNNTNTNTSMSMSMSGGTGTYNPSLFISPPTSESNFLSVSQCQRLSSCGASPPNQLQPHTTSESDLTEILSCVTSGSNSPIVDLDFPPLNDQNFPFDASNFFSYN